MEWLNYHHLLYFYRTARAGSIARASKELHLTPQTISGQIRALETALGEDLFHREGRRLVLTDVGRQAYRYAEEIFALGKELVEGLRGLPTTRPLTLHVGVADVLPKLVAHRELAPALKLDQPVKLVCHVDKTDKLLSHLVTHELDVVLTDAPIPPSLKIRAYNHLLGQCSVTFVAAPALAATLRDDFPRSLDGAPVLLPTRGTALRGSLETWFEALQVRPQVVGEFADSGLLKVFGQTGAGAFAVPSIVHEEVCAHYEVEVLGEPEGIQERFYAISVERKVRHPAVVAICQTAREDTFA